MEKLVIRSVSKQGSCCYIYSFCWTKIAQGRQQSVILCLQLADLTGPMFLVDPINCARNNMTCRGERNDWSHYSIRAGVSSGGFVAKQ